MRLSFVVLMLSISLAVAGCKSDPATPEYWSGRLEDAKGKKGRKKVVEDLRESKHNGAVMLPVLHKQLATEKSSEVKEKIALLLGEMKDKSSIDPLIDAVDLGASDSEARRVNKEIAVALGHIGDPRAVPTLVKLASSKDEFTIISAVEALGELKAKEGFDRLYELSTDETIAPFITKKAIIALGELRDDRAVPGLVKMMFKERKGISFYSEASFSLYQLGPAASDALITVAQSKDKELSKWAAENRILPAALTAKAAQVLGDLHELKAENAIIDLLNFKTEMDDIRLFVRMRAADALGRMRSKNGAKVLISNLDETEPNAIREYVWALTRIGGRDAVPKLLEQAGKGDWDRREEMMVGAAMLGDERELAAFDKFAKDEPTVMAAECKEYADDNDCKDTAKGLKRRAELIAKYRGVLEAAKECKDAGCWAKKLDDKNGRVRERAAYEVGRSGNAALVAELMKRLKEENLDARLGFIQGADWLVHDSKEAATTARTGLDDLAKQLEDERGRTQFQKTNEDLRRLHAKLVRS